MGVHKKHMKSWGRLLLINTLRPGAEKSKMGLKMMNCDLVEDTLPTTGSDVLNDVWPAYFAKVENPKKCQSLCFARPWSCGGYLVNTPAGQATQCVLFLRGRAGEMGATFKLPQEMTASAKFYKMACMGKFMDSATLLTMGKMMLMKRMPFMLSKVPLLMKGIKTELGLQEPVATPSTNADTDNPFARKKDPFRRRTHPSPKTPSSFGPPPPGTRRDDTTSESVNRPTADANPASNDDGGFKPEPTDVIQRGGVDAPEKPKRRGPEGAPPGWKPGQAEEGTGWKRSQAVDPEIAGEQEQRSDEGRSSYGNHERDPDAY